MHILPKTLSVLAAVVLLGGCGSTAEQGRTGAQEGMGAPLTLTEVEGETVAVAPLEQSGRLYSNLAGFVASAPVVVEGTLKAANPRFREVQAPISAEGVVEGDGPDLYGALDFNVTKVLKGDADLRTLRVVYNSGKRDGADNTKRIAYKHDGLNAFQLSNGELRRPAEVTGKKFVVFAAPSAPTDIDPTPHPSEYVLAHPQGIAEVRGSGKLSFGKLSKAPVSPDGTQAKASDLTVAQLRSTKGIR